MYTTVDQFGVTEAETNVCFYSARIHEIDQKWP